MQFWIIGVLSNIDCKKHFYVNQVISNQAFSVKTHRISERTITIIAGDFLCLSNTRFSYTVLYLEKTQLRFKISNL